jgi:Na+:H+ antiporter, NhaA family
VLGWSLPEQLRHWEVGTTYSFVVNGLMTLFFFAIGIELSHEIRIGQLRDSRKAIAPIVSALGGMVGTALTISVLGWLFHNAPARSSWGVPMATDVAFALGVLALGGPRIPRELRVFLLTLAVADDIFSVIALALTGPHVPDAGWTLLAIAIGLAVAKLARSIPTALWIIILIIEWLLFAKAGVEPSLAGVVIGLAVPFHDQRSVGHRLEMPVMLASTWLALPLFAFVATGVTWSAIVWNETGWQFGLFLLLSRGAGKVLGIVGAVSLTKRAGVGPDPSLTKPMFVGMALLCAVGFTVPLLFASNVFVVPSSLYLMATLSLLVASLLCAIAGVVILRRSTARLVAE